MSLETMKCPNCGAPLYFTNPNQEFCFCSSCGTQVYKNTHFDKQIEMEKLKEQSRNNKRNFFMKLVKGYIIYCIVAVVLCMVMMLFLKLMG